MQEQELRGHVQAIRVASHMMRERATAAGSDAARVPYSAAGADPVPESRWPDLVDNYLGGEMGQHCMYLTPVFILAVVDYWDALLERIERQWHRYLVTDDLPEVVGVATIARTYIAADRQAAGVPA